MWLRATCFNVKSWGKIVSCNLLHIYRKSHRKCSVRKGVLRNFGNLIGKYLCQGLFFNKLADLRLSHVTCEILPRGEIFSFKPSWKKLMSHLSFNHGQNEHFYTSFHPGVKIYLQRFAVYFTKMFYGKRRFVCSYRII